MTLKLTAALSALLLLAACGGGGGPAANKFVLRSDEAAFAGIEKARTHGGTLKVVLPVAAPGLDSPQIAVLQDGGRLNLAAGQEWAEPLPKLVQAQLVEAAEQAELFTNVVPDSQGVTARYSLMTDIREFALDQRGGKSEVKVRLVARIVNPANRVIVSSVSSSQTASIGSSTVDAFDEASSKAVREVIRKLSRKIR